MPKRWRTLLLPFSFLLLCFCGSPRVSSDRATWRSVTDDLGRRVQLPSDPRRIVSLAPSVTEMLFAIGAGDRVVGVTSLCDYPPQARALPKVGDLLVPSMERLLALQPDLVIVSTATPLERFARRLERMNIPLYVVDMHRVEDLMRSLRHLGEITNHRAQADAVARALGERLERVRARVSGRRRPRVLMVIQRDPLIVPGRGAFLTDLIAQAGGESLTADAEREWTAYSVESVVARAPDVIILPGSEPTTRRLAHFTWSALSRTPALRAGRVYAINKDLLFRPGPRLLDAVEELARVLHPEAFR